jgi:hypothetical protein
MKTKTRGDLGVPQSISKQTTSLFQMLLISSRVFQILAFFKFCGGRRLGCCGLIAAAHPRKACRIGSPPPNWLPTSECTRLGFKTYSREHLSAKPRASPSPSLSPHQHVRQTQEHFCRNRPRFQGPGRRRRWRCTRIGFFNPRIRRRAC